MKLVLSFVHPRKAARSVGPFASVRLDGESVRDHADGALLARHRDHQWELGGERYFRLEAATRVRVHFERHKLPLPGLSARSRVFGPYRRFAALDGVAYAEGRVFAFVDPKVGDWFCYDDGYHWPVMVLTDAEAKTAGDLLAFVAALAPALPGVFALWEGARLLYLGRAKDLHSRLLDFVAGDPRRITRCMWELSRDPARREAELLRSGGADDAARSCGIPGRSCRSAAAAAG